MKDHKRLTGDERDDLIAYLDGEMDPATRALMERKIAGSASAKVEVDSLRQTWDILDQLPMPKPKEDFTHRTIELVSKEKASGESAKRKAAAGGRKLLGIGAWILTVVACFVVSLGIARNWPTRYTRLLQDLPAVQRYDEYRAVRDIEFLRSLRDLKVLDALDQPLEPPPARKT